ncbi:MAG: MFS transporter [Acidimicrobiia bacterium]
MKLLNRRFIGSSPFRVMGWPHFRMLWLGLTASNIGTWLRQIAVSVLVFDSTGSPFLVGLTNVFGFVPVLLLTLLGGRTVDRTSSRAVLIGAQSFSMCISATLAILAILDLTPLPVLFGAVFLLGSSYAFTKPAAQALLPQLVPPDALADAVAVNGLQFTLGLTFGPAVATLVIKSFGMPAAFAVDAATFGLLLLAAVRLPASRPAESRGSVSSALKFVARKRVLLVLLTTIAASTIAIEIAKTLMPIFVVSSFGLDSANAGYLIAVFGVGTLVGSIIAPRLGARLGVTAAVLGLLTLGITVIAFSNTEHLAMAIPMLFGAGVSNLLSFTVITEMFFRLVPVQMRGRVFAVHALSFLGITPIAAFFSGAVAEAAGVPAAGSITGAFAFLAAFVLIGYRDDWNREAVDAASMPESRS